MKFVEVRFQNGNSLWFAIPAGMTRQQAIDFFFAQGSFADEGANLDFTNAISIDVWVKINNAFVLFREP